MAGDRFYSIKVPFVESAQGLFLGLTRTTEETVKAHLSHLIMTERGERLFRPDFGTNIPRFVFEPLDDQTARDLVQDISDTVKKHLSGVQINDIKVVQNQEKHFLGLDIIFSVTEGVFRNEQILELRF